MRLFRSLAGIAIASALAACAAVLGLPDPSLDESAGGGGNGNDGGNGTGVDGAGPGDSASDDDSSAVLPDGRTKTCIGSNAWTTPVKIDLASNFAVKIYPSLTEDELTIFWTEVLPAQNKYQISKASRSATDAGFGVVSVVSDQSLSYESACPTATGGELYASNVLLPNGPIDRVPLDGGSTQMQAGFDTLGPRKFCRTLLADAGVIYGHSENGDPNDPAQFFSTIFRAERTGPEDWKVVDFYRGEADASEAHVFSPAVSRDELEMFFAGNGQTQPGHITRVGRGDASAQWGTATEVAALSAPDRVDEPGWLSADGCRLYFARAVVPEGGAFAGYDIYVASRTPQ